MGVSNGTTLPNCGNTGSGEGTPRSGDWAGGDGHTRAWRRGGSGVAGEQVGAERGAAGLDAALGTTRLEAEGETRED